jgi:hypothetical protein
LWLRQQGFWPGAGAREGESKKLGRVYKKGFKFYFSPSQPRPKKPDIAVEKSTGSDPEAVRPGDGADLVCELVNLYISGIQN